MKSWMDELTNRAEMCAIFPNGGLCLSRFTFLQCSYVPGNKLSIVLLYAGLPADAPERWRTQGATSLQCHFDLGLTSLHINIPKELDNVPELTVAIGPREFRVFDSDASGQFDIQASTFYVKLRVNPVACDSL